MRGHVKVFFQKKFFSFTWRRIHAGPRESFFQKKFFSFTWRRIHARSHESFFSKKNNFIFHIGVHS
jgi:hypothetical protein